MNKLWKRFDQEVEHCYENMIGAYEDANCWQRGFEAFKEALLDERAKNKAFARKLYLVDDETDCNHNVEGWLEDYLDEMDMRKEYKILLQSCDWLIEAFDWSEDSSGDLFFDKSLALQNLGRIEESSRFCEEWLEREADSPYAATAYMYVKMKMKDYESAQKILDRFIDDTTECNEETDLLFVAAEKLYELTGNKKKKKEIQKAQRKYEEYLENYYSGNTDDDDEMDDWELPFS